MATIMEKDVLLEFVAENMALSYRKTKGNRSEYGFTPDEKKLSDIRYELYRTDHKDIDYEVTAKRLNEFREKLSSMEDGAIIWRGDDS